MYINFSQFERFLCTTKNELPTFYFLRSQTSFNSNKTSKHIKTPKPSLSSSRTTKTSTPDQSKKYVTFSNNTEIVPDLRICRSANSDRSDVTFSAKPDLPGRVSFSKNDVYEIDFSDYENDVDDELALLPKTSDRNQEVKTLPKSTDSRTNQIDKIPSQFCCPLKCNSMACSTEAGKLSYDPKNYQALDESSQIIEDYKNSIKDINRQYQLDSERSTDVFIDSPRILPYENISDDFKTYQSKVLLPDEHETGLIDIEAEPDESTEVEAEQKLNDEVWLNIPASNHSERPSTSDFRPATADTMPSKDSYNSEVISNYLKETNQKIGEKSKKPTRNVPPKLSPNSTKKTQVSNRNSDRLKMPLKPKTKLACRREESNIGEFQIDKVESWMSLHQKNFERTDAPDRYASRNEDKDGGSVDWSLKTPCRTVDRDNSIFVDESIENASLEGSPYDEIVSIIKEIDAHKQLDLGK